MQRKYLVLLVGIGGILLFALREPSPPAKASEDSPTQRGADNREVARQQRVVPTKGSIAGSVKDEETHAIANARVCAVASSPELSSEDLLDRNCVQTSASGAFHFPHLRAARYLISASIPNYLPASYQHGEGDLREASFALAEGEERTGVDIELRRGGVEVKGIVKDIGGGPVAGAWVALGKNGAWFSEETDQAVALSLDDGTFSAWVAEGRVTVTATASGYAEGFELGLAPGHFFELIMTPESVLAGRVLESSSRKPVVDAEVEVGNAITLTDGDGRFRVTGLKPGRYKPNATMRAAYGEATQSVLLGLGETREDVTIEMHSALYVSGHVLIDQGDEVCDAQHVELTDGSGERTYDTRSNPQTKLVEFKGILPGSYKVSVYCAGFVGADNYPRLELTNKDRTKQVWRVSSGERISGRVLDADGKPIVDARVSARPTGGGPNDKRDSETDTTEEDGSFQITGILPGKFHMQAYSSDYLSPKDPIEIAVVPGKVENVSLTLSKGGALKGEVVDDQGHPMKAVTLRARNLADRRGGSRAKTKDDGSFEMAGLRPGRYRVSAGTGLWGRQVLRAPGTGDDDVQGEVVQIYDGETAELKLVVQSQSGTISGVVVNESGKPVSDAFVDSERQSDATGAAKSGALISARWRWSRQPTLTDVDGRFTLRNLAEGTYTLLAYRRGGGEAVSTDVVLGSDAIITIKTTAALSGTASLAGKGVPTQFEVQLSDNKSGFNRNESFYRTQGAWSMTNLPAGNYEVVVTASEGTGRATAVLAEGVDSSGVEVRLLGRTTVTGRIVDMEDGSPVAGMRVGVNLYSGKGGIRFDSHGDDARISDKDGRFAVADSPVGRVTVSAIPENWRESNFEWFKEIRTVESGDSFDIGDLKAITKRLKRGENAGDLGFKLKQNEASVTQESKRLEVALIDADGPAADSGLKVGDAIVSVDGHDVSGGKNFRYRSLTRVPVGTTLSLALENGETIKIRAAKGH